MAETLLLNFVIWRNVGHMVEAMAAAWGYKRANPLVDVHVVVNAATVVELAGACPWVTAVHTVDIPDADAPVGPELVRHIERDWDYVVVEDRGAAAGAYSAYAELARTHFRARIATDRCAGRAIPFDHWPALRLQLPADSRARAAKLAHGGGTQIAVAPAGGSRNPRYYPSVRSWSLILEALAARHPDLTVHLIGRLSGEGPRTATAMTRADLDLLLERHPFCRDRFDVGFLDQLAVVEGCGVFISPHTGLAFAALAVGTPWATISGGRWRESFVTGTPFYSVLPDPKRYPAFDPETFATPAPDGSGRIASMCDRRIAEDLPELLEAVDALLEGRWTFWRCVNQRERNWARLYGTRRDRLTAAARELARPLTRYADRPLLPSLRG